MRRKECLNWARDASYFMFWKSRNSRIPKSQPVRALQNVDLLHTYLLFGWTSTHFPDWSKSKFNSYFFNQKKALSNPVAYEGRSDVWEIPESEAPPFKPGRWPCYRTAVPSKKVKHTSVTRKVVYFWKALKPVSQSTKCRRPHPMDGRLRKIPKPITFDSTPGVSSPELALVKPTMAYSRRF